MRGRQSRVRGHLEGRFGPLLPGEEPAVVGMGSNLGDRMGLLAAGLEGMARAEGVRLLSVSRVYETEPVGPPQPHYLNAVAILATTLPPMALLRLLQDLEARAGRRRGIRWGPRTLDLDLLFYGDEVISLPELEVPHPRVEERAFVLAPLAELAPKMPLPSGRTAREALEALGVAGGPSGVRPYASLL